MDSLDCSSYEPETIARSCRTNMNNYTIAFEASMTGSGMEHRESGTLRDAIAGADIYWCLESKFLPNTYVRSMPNVVKDYVIDISGSERSARDNIARQG